jgi:hypothetical protein
MLSAPASLSPSVALWSTRFRLFRRGAASAGVTADRTEFNGNFLLAGWVSGVLQLQQLPICLHLSVPELRAAGVGRMGSARRAPPPPHTPCGHLAGDQVLRSRLTFPWDTGGAS